MLFNQTFMHNTIEKRSLLTSVILIGVVLASGLLETKAYEKNHAGQVINANREASKYGAICSCKSEFLLNKRSKERRRVELEDWERLYEASKEPLVQCPAFSPFQFIGYGITVQPLESTNLHGFSFSRAISNDSLNLSKIQLRCRNSLGVLYIPHEDHRQNITGNKTAELTIMVNCDVETINEVLSTIRYESTVYSIESRDIIDVIWRSFHVSIHVHIKRQERPFLYDPGQLQRTVHFRIRPDDVGIHSNCVYFEVYNKSLGKN